MAFTILHFSDGFAEAIAIIDEDCEVAPEDFCPPGMELTNTVECEETLPPTFPVDNTWRRE